MIEVDMYNPNKRLPKNNRQDKEKEILKILREKAPNITWDIKEEDRDSDDLDRIVVRGSFVSPNEVDNKPYEKNHVEYMSKTAVWNMKFSMPMQDLVEDVAIAFEKNRKEIIESGR